MTSFPLQLKDFIDDTLINQINIKTTLSTSLHTSRVTIDGVNRKVNTVRECFFCG